MKAVHLLVNSVLPPDLRNNDQTYDIKSLNKILHAVAFKHPDQFADVEKKISDIGRKASYYQGETITLNDLTAPFDRTPYFQEMEAAIKALPKNKDFESNRIAIMQKYNDLIEKANAKSSLEQRNNIAMSVLSGARGKGAQLKAMVATPGTFSDYKGRVVPVFSKESFAEGVRPAVFLASTNGARSSVISTKCLDYQSLVKMADLSEKKLCDIQPGDMVLGADKEGHVFPVKVLNVFDQGEKECYKYTFRYSNSKIALNDVHVICTEDHKFLVISSREYNRKRSLHSRGNGPAPTWRDRHNKEIHTASKFKRASRASDYNPLLPQGGLFGNKNEPWARILGLLIGDGCLTGNHTHCTLSCADPQLIEEITPELTALGQKIKKASGDNFTWNITKADYNPTQNNSIVKGVQGFVAGSLMDRNQMLRDYGLLGHYAWEKRFPAGWQSWDEESMKNLIAGLFAADGSVFSTLSGRKDRIQVGISFGMTSEDCLKDLREALMYGFGISSRFEKPTNIGGFRSSTEERVHPLYALEISRAEDVIKFCETFADYIPGIKRAKLVEETSKIVIKDHNPYAKAMFLEKEYAGKVHCMDIEVDHPDHLFVLANGPITSNSSTAKGGDLAKQLASSSADLVVRKEDCGTENGIELSIDDKSMRGRVLAKDAYGLKAGTVIGRNELDKLKKAGADSVVVRSPQTCSVPNGLCAHCVGRFYNGSKMPKVGDSIGLLASSTVGEPITQMALCINELQPVSMADGSVKPIKDITVGDMVLGADKAGHTFPVKVLNTYDQGIRKTRVYTIKLLETTEEVEVSCTKDHKFLNEYGDIVPVKELVESPSTSLCTDRGLGVIVSISPEKDTHCRDIEVDHSDHLFVLAGGIITSNSAKHTAGMSAGKKSYSGLGTIIQFTQSPEAFKDRGAVSEIDGKVTSVEEAPQGGMFVTVDDKKHYVLPGHEVYVKPGDTVEAGDQLAEGLVDPEDIVRLKGLGEGKLYYAERLHQMLQDSGAGTDRRNTEVLARGAIRHIKITDPEGMGSYLPDDVVDYNAAQNTYKVPETAREVTPKEAVGKYLQKPYLHYTVGTRVTPTVAKKLAKNKYDSLLVDDIAPGFVPHMVRLRTASHTNPDWMASLATSSIAKQLNESATRGDDTNVISNPDFRPRLAVGENFGKNVTTTGEF